MQLHSVWFEELRARTATRKLRRTTLEKKWFWLIFIVLSLIADFTVPLVWSLILTLPILVLSWWLAYKSGIFD